MTALQRSDSDNHAPSGLDLSKMQDYIDGMLRLTKRNQQQKRLSKAVVARVRSEAQT
jgi:hypothetical protein